MAAAAAAAMQLLVSRYLDAFMNKYQTIKFSILLILKIYFLPNFGTSLLVIIIFIVIDRWSNV